jgi:phosphodiesterase/alkaline phosphatase D-like protein
MNRLLLKLAIAATVGSLSSNSTTVAQPLSTPAPKAAQVVISQGPDLESAHGDWAIISWISNNPGGEDDHYGLVSFGTDPSALNQTAKSHVRLNRGHSDTTFRVRVVGLKPGTTYYYKVTSVDGDGTSDAVQSPVSQFTTPGP